MRGTAGHRTFNTCTMNKATIPRVTPANHSIELAFAMASGTGTATAGSVPAATSGDADAASVACHSDSCATPCETVARITATQAPLCVHLRLPQPRFRWQTCRRVVSGRLHDPSTHSQPHAIQHCPFRTAGRSPPATIGAGAVSGAQGGGTGCVGTHLAAGHNGGPCLL